MTYKTFWTPILTIVAAVVLLAAAVDGAAARDRVGFFGGVNIANMGGDMDRLGDEITADLEAEIGGDWSASRKADVGFGAGAYYYLARSTNFGLQLEVQYVQRGTKFGLRVMGLDFEAAFRTAYVEVPLLLRYTPGEPEDQIFFMTIGPVIGFRVGADLELSGQGMSESTDVGDDFASTTVGALVGVGLAHDLTASMSFLLQARYYQGLTDALDTEGYSSRSRDYGFFAGLEFGLGR
ncbi:MAG: porin family protein [Candidatus Krumholzibacteriia bacterium]